MASPNNSWASYDSLNDRRQAAQQAEKAGYIVIGADNGFINLWPIEKVSNDPVRGFGVNGKHKGVAKLHISVPPGQTPEAWDLIVDKLVEQKLEAKVIPAESQSKLVGDKAFVRFLNLAHL
jgi:hypothetical protein